MKAKRLEAIKKELWEALNERDENAKLKLRGDLLWLIWDAYDRLHDAWEIKRDEEADEKSKRA